MSANDNSFNSVYSESSNSAYFTDEDVGDITNNSGCNTSLLLTYEIRDDDDLSNGELSFVSCGDEQAESYTNNAVVLQAQTTLSVDHENASPLPLQSAGAPECADVNRRLVDEFGFSPIGTPTPVTSSAHLGAKRLPQTTHSITNHIAAVGGDCGSCHGNSSPANPVSTAMPVANTPPRRAAGDVHRILVEEFGFSPITPPVHQTEIQSESSNSTKGQASPIAALSGFRPANGELRASRKMPARTLNDNAININQRLVDEFGFSPLGTPFSDQSANAKMPLPPIHGDEMAGLSEQLGQLQLARPNGETQSDSEEELERLVRRLTISQTPAQQGELANYSGVVKIFLGVQFASYLTWVSLANGMENGKRPRQGK
jgi:hypothetical protein